MRAPEKKTHLKVFYGACCESYNTRHILLKHFSRYALPDVYSRITQDNYSDKARSAELAIIISYPTSASGIIVLSKLKKRPQNIERILRDFICKNN